MSTKPAADPRRNGKIERYNRILTEELLYSRIYTSETQRTRAINTWNTHYNHHRLHSAAAGQPPATHTPDVTNVPASYI